MVAAAAAGYRVGRSLSLVLLSPLLFVEIEAAVSAVTLMRRMTDPTASSSAAAAAAPGATAASTAAGWRSWRPQSGVGVERLASTEVVDFWRSASVDDGSRGGVAATRALIDGNLSIRVRSTWRWQVPKSTDEGKTQSYRDTLVCVMQNARF